MLMVQPNQGARLKERSGSMFLPRAQLTAIGSAYEIPSSTTDAEIMALKALVDPKKIQPKIVTRARLRYSELRGTFSVG